jgi:tRNA(fMet)-specific endonuclease VapC
LSLLIDTNVAILLRDGDHDTTSRLIAAGERPAASLVTVVELEGGNYAAPEFTDQRRRGLMSLLPRLLVQPLDQPVVDAYGAIVRDAGFSRRKILDRLIAATALVHDFTLVTTNPDDFRDIPGLRLEVWPAPQ